MESAPICSSLDWNKFFSLLPQPPPSFSTAEEVQSLLDTLAYCQSNSAKPPPKRYSKPGWWNEICKQAIRKRNSALRKLNQLPKGSVLRPARKRTFYRLAATARKTIIEEKTKWKEDLIRKNSTTKHSNVWKVINKLCGGKRTRSGSIQSPEKLYQAQIKSEELCKSFELIQRPPDLAHIPHDLPPSELPCTHFEPTIEEWEVHEAISSIRNKSCPGPDGILVLTIKKLWAHPSWKPVLLSLISVSFSSPQVFSPFKHAIIHPVPKPGKPGAFRPIALLSQIGKILERIVSHRLRRLLHIDNQFGCWPHRTTQDALVRLQNWAVNADYGALSIFFDVSKAYDRVAPLYVLRKLSKIQGVSRPLLKWVSGFLQGRTFQVRMSGQSSKYIGTPQVGLPQGSPLSVILWQIFVSDIPINHDDNLYMDDLNYNIDASSYDEVEEIATYRLRELDSWAKANGVLFDKIKTKVLTLESHVEVQLKFHPLDADYIPQVTKYKYLGCWISQRNDIDLGFSLEAQLEHEKEDFIKRISWIKALYRAPISTRRTAYLSLIRSKIEYSLLLTIRNYELELELLQSKALRIVSGATKSTPGYKLRASLQIPSILALAKAQAIRMRGKMLAYGGLLSDDYDSWIQEAEGVHSAETPFGLIQSETLVPNPDWFFQNSYSSPRRDHCRSMLKVDCQTSLAKQEFLELLTKSVSSPDSLEVYCDGSFLRDLSTGSTGWVIFKGSYETPNLSGGISYCPVFSSYQCEFLALRDSLRYVLEVECPSPNWSNLVIYTDSKSVLLKLCNFQYPSTHKKSPIEFETLSLLNQLASEDITISLQWVPGHSGIPGNEQADRRAEMAILIQDPIHIGLDLEYYNRQARNTLKQSWHSVQMPLPPLTLKRLWKTNYKLATFLLRLINKHNYLRGCHWERSLLGGKRPRVESYLCRFCEQEIETAAHVVNSCSHPDVVIIRDLILWQRYTLPSPERDLLLYCLLNPHMWKHLMSFFKTLDLNP
jgi:ribonuclease HI